MDVNVQETAENQELHKAKQVQTVADDITEQVQTVADDITEQVQYTAEIQKTIETSKKDEIQLKEIQLEQFQEEVDSKEELLKIQQDFSQIQQTIAEFPKQNEQLLQILSTLPSENTLIKECKKKGESDEQIETKTKSIKLVRDFVLQTVKCNDLYLKQALENISKMDECRGEIKTIYELIQAGHFSKKLLEDAFPLFEKEFEKSQQLSVSIQNAISDEDAQQVEQVKDAMAKIVGGSESLQLKFKNKIEFSSRLTNLERDQLQKQHEKDKKLNELFQQKCHLQKINDHEVQKYNENQNKIKSIEEYKQKLTGQQKEDKIRIEALREEKKTNSQIQEMINVREKVIANHETNMITQIKQVEKEANDALKVVETQAQNILSDLKNTTDQEYKETKQGRFFNTIETKFNDKYAERQEIREQLIQNSQESKSILMNKCAKINAIQLNTEQLIKTEQKNIEDEQRKLKGQIDIQYESTMSEQYFEKEKKKAIDEIEVLTKQCDQHEKSKMQLDIEISKCNIDAPIEEQKFQGELTKIANDIEQVKLLLKETMDALESVESEIPVECKEIIKLSEAIEGNRKQQQQALTRFHTFDTCANRIGRLFNRFMTKKAILTEMEDDCSEEAAKQQALKLLDSECSGKKLKNVIRQKILESLDVDEDEEIEQYIQEFLNAIDQSIKVSTKFNNFADEKKLANIRKKIEQKYMKVVEDEDDREEFENLWEILVSNSNMMRDQRLEHAKMILINKSRKQNVIICMKQLVHTLIILPRYDQVASAVMAANSDNKQIEN